MVIAIARPSEGLNPADRFRLRALSYSSFGAMFLAIVPFAVFKGPWAESTSWLILGIVITLYTGLGLLFFPRASHRLRRDYPHLYKFRQPLAIVQFANDIVRFLLSLVVLFGPNTYQAGAYTMVLVLLLLQGVIAFMRVVLHNN